MYGWLQGSTWNASCGKHAASQAPVWLAQTPAGDQLTEHVSIADAASLTGWQESHLEPRAAEELTAFSDIPLQAWQAGSHLLHACVVPVRWAVEAVVAVVMPFARRAASTAAHAPQAGDKSKALIQLIGA